VNRNSGVAEILRELVAIPTPSAVSNLPLLHVVAAYLEELGWSVRFYPYIDDAGVEKANLLAWPGAGEIGERFELAFICHTDTVPYAEVWAKALDLEARDGQLHGCGSCDVKGSLACFLSAIGCIDAQQLKPGVALILTADEEIGCKGMERFLASTSLKMDAAIVSEPTSLRPGIAGKGYGLARIVVEGKEAHSAFPDKGVSAISVAARLIVAIEERFDAEHPSGEANVLFDPPRTTLNIGVIEGGTAKNIVPGRCSFLVEWRAVPGEEPMFVLEQLRGLAEQAQQANAGAPVHIEGLRAEPGFAPTAEGALQQQLAALLGTEPVGISFGSEASRVARIADEVIVIGPGEMRTAHSDRECVPIDELERWMRALHELIRR
jgi:acetylornithine deacetylase